MAMKLSTGKVAFPIEFDNGDKECIYFNPSDPDLISRISNLQNKISNRIKTIEDVKLTAEGESEDKSFADFIQNFQNILYEEIDQAFGGEVSAVVFKHCSPFAIVGGEYFIVQFVRAIIPEIRKRIEKANAAVEKNMAKHLNKYAK